MAHDGGTGVCAKSRGCSITVATRLAHVTLPLSIGFQQLILSSSQVSTFVNFKKEDIFAKGKEMTDLSCVLPCNHLKSVMINKY